MAIITFGTGHELLTFTRTREPVTPAHDADIPVTWSIVVLTCQGKYVLLYNIVRNGWEIPGGGIEPDEHPDDCARREVQEETSQIVDEVTCYGVMKVRLNPENRLEYGVIYTAPIDELSPFIANTESSAITLWDYGTPIEGYFGELSRYLIDKTRE